MPSKCAQGQFYLYLYNFPRFNLEICPISFAFGGRMKGLTLLRNVSYVISYSNPDLTPSSVTISNLDYLVLTVTTKRSQSRPTCGRDDRALRFRPLRLLCHSLQSHWCTSASLKRSFLYSGHGKKPHVWRLRKRSIPLSVYCYILFWPKLTKPKRLPLPKFIATTSVLTKCLDDLEGTQEEESLRI